MVQPEWLEKDFYQDLNLSSSASAADIKKSYRKLARQLHPDANPGDKQAEEKFKKVSEAYSVLGDSQKKQEYDQARELMKNGSYPGGGFGGANTGNYRTTYSNGNFNPDDLFGNNDFQSTMGGGGLGDFLGGLFSGANNRGNNRGYQSPPAKGRDQQAEFTISFREAALGTTKDIQLTGSVTCPICKGTGKVNGKTCNNCGGTGITYGNRNIKVKIPAGVDNGGKIRLAGKGEPGPIGAKPGDLYLTIRVTTDKLFTRSGTDLRITVPVAFTELVEGTTLTVPTLDSQVSLKIPGYTANGKVFRVKGKGIAKPKQMIGDLLVKLEVKVPEKLSDKAKKVLAEYAQLEKADGFIPRDGWDK